LQIVALALLYPKSYSFKVIHRHSFVCCQAVSAVPSLKFIALTLKDFLGVLSKSYLSYSSLKLHILLYLPIKLKFYLKVFFYLLIRDESGGGGGKSQ
jgi:hypothetical protein